ncbi:MAG: transposase [Pirellulales bacterium]|nr:transposase [Pirellulales bacterium]
MCQNVPATKHLFYEFRGAPETPPGHLIGNEHRRPSKNRLFRRQFQRKPPLSRLVRLQTAKSLPVSHGQVKCVRGCICRFDRDVLITIPSSSIDPQPKRVNLLRIEPKNQLFATDFVLDSCDALVQRLGKEFDRTAVAAQIEVCEIQAGHWFGPGPLGGKLTKENLNNRGYNKFLRLHGEIHVEIDEKKIVDSAKWDGLKGYLTNAGLSPAAVLENYGQLWHVEKAFRISKTDLRIRPMYHRRRGRIEAHVLIAFVAYTIYKDLERRLAEAHIALSPQRVADLTHTMYEMTFRLPDDPEIHHTLLQMDPDQQRVYDLLY